MTPIERWASALEMVVEDLAAEVEHRYAATKDHPAVRMRYDRDMEPVIAARAVLAEMRAVTAYKGSAAEVRRWDDSLGEMVEDPYDWEFSTNTTGERHERPALLILLPETSDEHSS